MLDNLTIGLTAAPRAVNYLPRTLASLYLAGAPAVRVFAEPKMPPLEVSLPLPIHYFVNADRFGNWRNWLRMCRHLLAGTRSPYLLTCEDDVEFAPESIREGLAWLATLPNVPGAGLVSLYTSPKYDLPPATSPQPLAPNPVLGACAWLWPRASLQAVLAHPLTAAWTGNTIGNVPTPLVDQDGVDTLVGRVLRDLGRTMYFVNPSSARHIGQVSTFAGKAWPNVAVIAPRDEPNALTASLPKSARHAER